MRTYIKYDEFSHPEDMRKILTYLRAHGELQISGAAVERLYYEFSASRSAGWLFATDETIREFADWLSDTDP